MREQLRRNLIDFIDIAKAKIGKWEISYILDKLKNIVNQLKSILPTIGNDLHEVENRLLKIITENSLEIKGEIGAQIKTQESRDQPRRKEAA